MAKIYFEPSRDPSLKQAILSMLEKMLLIHTMMIVGEKFKYIIILYVVYIKQAIFKALESICMKKSVLKQIIHINLAFDNEYIRNDLITKSNCPCSSCQLRSNKKVEVLEVQTPQASRDRTKAFRRNRYFRKENVFFHL